MEQANGLLIKMIHDGLEKRANNTLRPKELTMMQVAVLMSLRDAPEKRLCMKDIERLFQIAQPTAAGVIKRLEQKGLVCAQSDADDKRVKLACITAQGEACCIEAQVHMREAEELLLAGFSSEERALFGMLLQRAADNVR